METTNRNRLPATFWWANLTQFGGAMNDNLFKLFMIYALLDWSGPGSSAEILASVGIAFALPFLLIIPIAGSFADHFSKQALFVRLKAAEVAVMGFGIFALNSGSAPLLYVTMLLMSAQSAFFGPCKYGIIPELVDAERLSKANGMVQLFTFLAIIAGTIIAPELSLILNGRYEQAAWICLLVAGGGFLFSLKIRPTPGHPARKVNFNGFANLFHSARDIRKDGYLTLAVLATAFFSLIGAFVQLNVLDFGAQHLDLLPEQATRLFLLTAIGIGTGSVFAGWISGRSIEFGIVPIGAGLMFLGLVVLGTLPHAAMLTAAGCMFVLGLAAGMFIVPLESFIQYRSPGDKVGSIKAAGGFLSWIGILTASGLIFLNSAVLGWTAQGGFLLVSVLLLVLTVFSLWILPDFLVKFLVMVITRTLYRLRVYGLDNLPHDKPALLVSNHVSLMDALILLSSQQRRIRMLMSRNVYTNANPFVKWIVRLSGVILVQDTDGPKKLLASLKQARKALDDGFLVCIFAEGGLTLTGMLRPFKPGFERIVKGSGHPIIPVYIGGAWGSVASFRKGMPRLRPFSEYRYPVSVHFGQSLPSDAGVFAVRQAVSELSTEVHEARKPRRRSIGEAYVALAMANWDQLAVADATAGERTHGQLLMQAGHIRQELRDVLGDAALSVGVFLEQGVDAAIANVGIVLDGRVPVNLDPRQPEPHLKNAFERADISAAITSRRFLKNHPGLPLPETVLFMEDLAADSPAGEARRPVRLLPRRLAAPVHGFDPDDTAAILFTSGRSGEPKGVRLSHQNILSSIDALTTVMRPGEPGHLLGTLPLHNAFGYVLTLWLPLLSGMPVSYAADPRDGAAVGSLAATSGATILPATPALLERYIQSVEPEQFAGLQFVFSGGNTLDPAMADAFRERFGLQPLEAYGATELSGVCALSVPDVRISRFRETGQRAGRQGRLLPGIAMKIVDPERGAECPPGEVGQVLVKGAVVMRGYLEESETDAVMKDGWYRTGDYGSLDADGFFAIESADPQPRK